MSLYKENVNPPNGEAGVSPYIQGGVAALEMGSEIYNLANSPTAATERYYNIEEMPTFEEEVNPYAKGVGGRNALKWAATGASVGMAFSPIGAAVGAGIGALAGGVSGLINSSKRKRFQEGQDAQFQRYRTARGNFFEEQADRRLRMARQGFNNPNLF